jgi:hypothetical protein
LGLVALFCAALSACQLQKLPPKSADERPGALTADDREPAPGETGGIVKPSSDAALNPSRKAGAHKDGESIPQILARTRDQLQTEVAKNLQLTESLQRANTRIAELDASVKSGSKDTESLRAEKEKLQAKVRELQERLVTAALRIASTEKEMLEVKIAYERAIATAAESGILLDATGGSVKAESRPSAAGAGAAARAADAKGKPAHEPAPVKSGEHR